MSYLSRPKRACDRCHSIKERCRRIAGSATCERCSRLKHNCYTERPLQRVGRRSRYTALEFLSSHKSLFTDDEGEAFSFRTSSTDTDRSPSSSASEPSTSLIHRQLDDISRYICVFGNLDTIEQHLLQLSVGDADQVGRFTIGPSFHLCHQRALISHLNAATPQLKDALLSCASVFADSRSTPLSESARKLCHKRAATAISLLSSLQISDRRDVSICLVLGLAMTTFAQYVAFGEVFTVCRYTLNLVKPAYDSCTNFDSDEISFLICLILTETVECLFRGDIPTLRFKSKEGGLLVDRFMGLSSPLLPYLFDLCKIGRTLRSPNDIQCLSIFEELSQIEHEILGWQPITPTDFLERFEQVEVVNMLSQVKVLRLTILLIVHRFRYPFGTRNGKAFTLSNSIMKELELAIQLTGKPHKCSYIAFMAASFELETSTEKANALGILDTILRYSDHFQNKITQWLTSFWTAKDRLDNIYWFNLSDHLHATAVG